MLSKAFYTVLGAIALFGLAHAAQIPLPGVNGPYLGDQNNNLYTLTLSYIQNSGQGAHAGISASQTSGQVNCTQLDSNALQQVTTSASTGYVCLPTAYSGKSILIGNGVSGQTIDIYSSATSYTSGTADTINGTAGTSAYTGLSTGKNTLCFAPANGAWYCSSGS